MNVIFPRDIILNAFKLGGRNMSRICPVTGKGPQSGNKRSHSLRATRRRWSTNLQKFKVEVDGKPMTIRMSTRAYRTLNKTR